MSARTWKLFLSHLFPVAPRLTLDDTPLLGVLPLWIIRVVVLIQEFFTAAVAVDLSKMWEELVRRGVEVTFPRRSRTGLHYLARPFRMDSKLPAHIHIHRRPLHRLCDRFVVSGVV